MTIKFERFADNYMCKDYFYKIWDDLKNADYEDVLDFRSLKMKDYEFEKLFKDMAKELGYTFITYTNDGMTKEKGVVKTEALNQKQPDNLYDFDNFVSRCQEYADKEFLKNPIIIDEDKNKILNIDKYVKSEQQHKLELRIDRLDKKITNIFQDLNSVINNNITNIDKNEKKWYKVLGRIDNINENVERIDNKCNNDYISNDSQIQKLQEQLSGQDEWNDYISERLEKLENISNRLKDMNDYRQKQIEINKRHVEMLVNQDKRIDELEKQVSVLSEDLDWDE